MPFLAYLVILTVSVGGILLELDWLTKPKLETRPAAQTASAAAPVKVDGPSVALSPVRPKNADDAVLEKPPVTTAAAEAPPAETTAAAPAETAQASPQIPAAPPILSSPAMDAPTATISAPAVATPVVATSESKPEIKSETKPATKSEPHLVQNQCNIAACTGAYRSFRGSDCSYQPIEGARRLCELTPGAAKTASQPREWHADSNARQRSRDAELRDVARKVKEITAREAELDDEPADEGRVIMLRDRPRNWRSW